MLKIEVFDPSMCCETGICGDEADSTLVIFASDLEWLKTKGIEVKRYGLSLAPDEFEKNQIIKELVDKKGTSCLPIILVDSKKTTEGCYPTREQLAEMCDIEFSDEEAPPIHREENCCCGVDCDCSTNQSAKNSCAAPKCDCSDSSCASGYAVDEFTKSSLWENIKKTIFILGIVLLFAILVIFTALKVHGT